MLIQARGGKLIEELDELCTYRDKARRLAIWAKGYFFDDSGRLYFDREISEWLAGQLPLHVLGELVPKMNGCFSLIILDDQPGRIVCASDRYGTVPIYYYTNGTHLVLSDDYWRLVEISGQTTFRESSVLDMLRLGYVTGTETILENIWETPWAGIQTFRQDGRAWKMTHSSYWRMSLTGTRQAATEEDLQDEWADLMNKVIRGYVQGLEARGWHTAIALSGGVDSRLLTALFRHLGSQDLSTFSYGSPEDPDVVYAAKIAQALGVPHRAIPVQDPSLITEELMLEMSTIVGATTRFTCGLGARFAQGSVPTDAVYITGHEGFPTVRSDLLRLKRQSQASYFILGNHFILAGDTILDRVWCGQDHRELTACAIRQTLDFDSAKSAESIKRWNFEQRQRRLILNELRTYERLGRWMLPFYDNRLADFLAALPQKFLMRRYLYINTMLSRLFAKDLAAMTSIPTASSGAFDPIKLTTVEQIRLRVGWGPLKELDFWQGRARKAMREGRKQYEYRHHPAAADPFDYWWLTSSDFRTRIISIFEEWDGLDGIIDTRSLTDLLRHERLPRYFLQFGIPSLLTLVFVQRIVQQISSRPGDAKVA